MIFDKKQNMYGYVRISSKSQKDNYSLAHQRDELIKYGVPLCNIFEEIGSGFLKNLLIMILMI